MPLTVTASNAIAYHLYQLPVTLSPEVEDTIEIDTIRNPLTDGYRSMVQVGFDAGVREWKLTFPGVSSYPLRADRVTGVSGALVSREDYIRGLYSLNKADAVPFVYEWRAKYYFVDFADEALSMQRMKVKIYSTGLTLRQRRIKGVSLPTP